MSARTRLTGILATVLAATTLATGPAAHASNATRPAMPAGTVGIRVITFNSDFQMPATTWRQMMNTAYTYNPDVILLQETQWRDSIIQGWATNHGYKVTWPAEDPSQEAVVMWKPARFELRKALNRLGAEPTTKSDGTRLGERRMNTARLYDKITHRRFAFTSLHTNPEVNWWPDNKGEPGAPNPFTPYSPRYGKPTYTSYMQYMARLEVALRDDTNAGFWPVVGGDFNAPAPYERQYAYRYGQTARIGDTMKNNHEALGTIVTRTNHDGTAPCSIDYLYTARTSIIRFIKQQTLNVPGDHHIVTVDLAVAKG